MKKNYLIQAGVILTIFFIGLLFYNKDFFSVKDERIQSVLSSKNIQGFAVHDSVSTEKYLIVNFWASWCPPCIQEIPSLSEFVQKNTNYKVVAISQDEELAEIKSILKTFPNLTTSRFEIVHDQTKSFSRLFKVEKLPETFIYEFQTGRILQVSGSIDWLSQETQNQLDQFFKTKN